MIIVDNNLIFRPVLKAIISVEKIAKIVGEASNGIELLNLLLQITPDLVLMDIEMKQMDGIEATQKALELYPDLKIIVLTENDFQEYYSYKMFSIGAMGFILKSKGVWELEKAIKEVMMGRKYFPEYTNGSNGKTYGGESSIQSKFKQINGKIKKNLLQRNFKE